jgi:Holliday junction resolvase RusA-like endonuclease
MNEHILTFEVPGQPIAQQRPRAASRGKFVTIYDAKESRAAKSHVALYASMAQGNKPVAMGALSATVEFHVKKPKSKIRKNSTPFPYPNCKPDIDNMIKLVFDAINGIIFKDDSQIISLTASKVWASEEPKTQISIFKVG